ncbi:MAG: hypothetical protein ABSC16_11135 [Candidatus Dormibacteria bacterium]|jgi:hypothetical protein|nr:hypothetical protein [Chloroflexota bacterium]
MQGRRTSWFSLFFGVVFLGVGALLLTGQVGVVTRLRWAGPILLIVIALCLIGWAVAERPRPMPGAPQAASPVSWGAGEGTPGTASSRGVAGGPGAERPEPAPEPAEGPGGEAEPGNPGDPGDPADSASPAG